MPSAWLLGPLIIKSALIVFVIGFGIGLLFLGFLKAFEKNELKQQIDDILSIVFTFIIALWIGKVLLRFPQFLEDPMAVLVYPSNTATFYSAVLLTIIYSAYTFKKKHISMFTILFSWMTVFLTTLFVYEFVFFIDGGSIERIGFLSLFACLTIYNIVFQGKIRQQTLGIILFFGWALGSWILAFFYQASIFQFYIDKWFLGVLLIVSILLLVYNYRKRSI